MTTRTIKPQRPDDLLARDPDFDELWDLADKLNQLLSVLVAGGASIEEALIRAGVDDDDEVRAWGMNPREMAILGMLPARTDEVLVPA